MRPNKSDVLIAFKAISLTTDMSVTEKRVAATLLDHYNRDTGQCDPALNTIATLLGINRRTAIRATGSLERSGYFRIDRHGGKFHRNSYQPIWARFRACENGWAEKRKRAKQFRSAASELSPLQGCHIGGGDSATQTYANNQSDLTSASQQRQSQQAVSAIEEPAVKWLSKQSGSGRQYSNAQERFHGKRSCGDIARTAAERRWNEALTKQLASAPNVFAGVIEAIDSDLSHATTEVEMRQPGRGVEFLLVQLDRRKPLTNADV
ncbi:helix-turn-helix domain-containing protein [Bradyrhizobium guangdongense]|uniref:helix-turn-helix domain-containing protein n=1 Tax=Bradyrhizobium guangdongense TaxID=1325090 RepID=UPI001319E262|nr:helix-turn-helix domain-containing protein [Bradyrhizobium guangdongense]